MRAKTLTRGTLVVLLGSLLAASGYADRFDYLVGANSPEGGMHLVKRFHVPGGSVISGVEFFSNEIGTTFPRVSILTDGNGTLSDAAIIADIRSVGSKERHRVSVACDPITIREDSDVFVAVTLPQSDGVRDVGDGVGIAARALNGAPNSYFVSRREGAFGETDMDFAIELMLETRNKTTVESTEDLAEGQTIPRRTFLNVSYGSANDAVVRFGVTETTDVALSIYNVRGQLVGTLDRGRLAAGNYVQTWRMLDPSGTRVASGVYLIRLTAGAEVLTQKMVVAR